MSETASGVAPVKINRVIDATGQMRHEGGPLFRRFARHRRGWKPLNDLQKAGAETFRKMVASGELTYETIACPLCDGEQSLRLSEIDKYGLEQCVVICRTCGFVFNNPMLTEASYIRYYDTIYRQIYMGYERPVDSYFEEQYEARGKRHVDYIQEVASVELDGRRVVEIGCGSGGILQAFRERGAHTLGFDFDSRFVEFGAERHGLELYSTDYRDFSFDPPADVVILSNVLEHILGPVAQLRDIRKIMADDGLLFIEVPALEGRRFGWSLQLAHVSYFSADTLDCVLRQAGFHVVDIRYHETFINCVARCAEPDPSARPEKGFRETLAFLKRMERMGCLDYHKHQWYYPYTVGPLDMLIKAVRNPRLAMDVLAGRRSRAH
ncbi:MAG: class I SAM-dependent methyltransferase [Phycisphaerales bacterium]|nr:class I SAM-dependent methyltransferase [Phycisphaerales bacterium]